MSMDWPDWVTTYERKIEEEARRKKRMSRRPSARLTKDRWFCDACNSWHPKKQECPKRIERIVDHVERSLAHAYGQRDSYADAFIAELATDINHAARYDDCGARIREHFLKHPELGRYILLVADRVCPHHRDDADLTDEQKSLVLDHLPLAFKAASKYAPTNAALRDELRTRAIEELFKLIHLWDPNRGVTFGAFAKRRLLGAMRDYVRKRPREFAVEPEKIDYLGPRTRKLPPKSKEDLPQSDSRRDSFFERGARLDKLLARTTPANELFARDPDVAKGSVPGLAHGRCEELKKLTDQFFATGGAIRTSRRGPPLTDELRRAIARLKPRQQAVYRGRVLTNPPVPRDKLARQLGIRDPTQVSRILRQAERNVARILKVSPLKRI